MLETLFTNVLPNSELYSTVISCIWLLPLVAFVIQIFVGKRLPRQGDWLSTGTIFLSLILSLLLFFDVLLQQNATFKFTQSWTWIKLSGFTVNFGFLVDSVTVLMLVVITGVSFLVHLYSIAYMKGDPRYSRFFAFLSFFSFAMVGLVVVDSLFTLYIFWELVGLASYLLIAFWFEKPVAAQAGKKAFIITRIGDGIKMDEETHAGNHNQH